MAGSNNSEPRNLSEAIDKLEHATQSKSQEMRELLGKDFTDLRKALEDLKPHLNEIQEKVKDQLNDAKKSVEGKIHENPWTSLAIVGLIGLFIGWIFGFGNRRGD
jgi:ElaB/YqjD/DUF883 family membrane-anchored ribosome-binding protein